MNLSSIPKFVINLDRRQDRLFKFDIEMNYIGWIYERFSAIDTNSYIGCAKSYQELAKIILDRNYKYAIVMEDDIYFMPYAKQLVKNLDKILFSNLEWDIINLAPSIHRPLNQYNEFLLDLTNLPPKDTEKHRGIFGTSGFILTQRACEYILEWNTNKYLENSHQQIPIDEYLNNITYPSIKSFCPILPLFVQRSDFSDINKTFDNNHYLMTYNWNAYCPIKLDTSMFDYETCQRLRQ